MRSTWRSAVAIAALTAGALGATFAPATAGAGETGCPGGFHTLLVSDLLVRGYDLGHLSLADLNLDGVVCGKPFSEQRQANYCESIGGCWVDVIYGFRDNDVAGY